MGRLAGTLLGICLATALLLGVVNQVTKPRIDAIQREKQEAAMAQVLPAERCGPGDAVKAVVPGVDGDLAAVAAHADEAVQHRLVGDHLSADVVAGFVTIVDLLLQAFFPDIAESLGVFIPLIVVNCIILARAESFASKNKPLAAAVDGLCQGVGYTLVLLVMTQGDVQQRRPLHTYLPPLPALLRAHCIRAMRKPSEEVRPHSV